MRIDYNRGNHGFPSFQMISFFLYSFWHTGRRDLGRQESVDDADFP